MQRSLALGSTNPKVWVVTEDRPGNNTQSIGLAEALVWPFEVKRLQFNVLARLPNRVLGASWLGVRAASRTTLGPPWPDVVIATGRRLAPVARWIRGQSQGRTRLIHLGRKGGHVPERFDLVVACAHFGLPDHPNRLEITIPVNPITRERLAQAALWRRIAVSILLALLPLPLEAALILLPVVGVALNGTSSVLYGSVPDLVEPAWRQRAFSIFYTGTIGAGAVSPAIYGLLGDAVGVPTALLIVAAVVLVTLPITLMLRPVLVARPS